MPKVAFVTGANGIAGGAILRHIATKATKDEWSHIIASSRSALQTTFEDSRVSLIALDFTKTAEELSKQMRKTCSDVIHAYFSSYIHKDDFAELNTANKSLFEKFLTCLLAVAPKLENCTLMTGGKYYGVHLHPIPIPIAEDSPKIGRDEDNFYYPQEDFLAEKQKGQTWTWNVIRPEAIIGYTKTPNGMNSALTYAVYFLVCKELGEEARMPTNQLYWRGPEGQCDAGLVAALAVWASTSPQCANEAFNVSNGDDFVWRWTWPKLAEYFGAFATSDQRFDKPLPLEGELQQELSLEEWAKDKRPVWDRLCDKSGLPEAKPTFDAATWGLYVYRWAEGLSAVSENVADLASCGFSQDWVFRRTWNSTLSMTKARKLGWNGYIDSYDSLTGAFDKFRELKQIP